MTNMNRYRGDFFGGITTTVVALPLALAFGVSSGAGALAGLYSAIFAGALAAVFGGTRMQITGPTGPMTVVMALVVIHFIDSSASVALDEVIQRLKDDGDTVLLFGARERVKLILEQTGVLDRLGRENLLDSRIDALRLAQAIIAGTRSAGA